MSKLYTKFTFRDYQGKEVVHKIHKNDVDLFKVQLLEASFVHDIGPVFYYDEIKKEWIELDYYND